MRDVIRRKLDKFERQDVFMVNNAADFSAGTPGHAAAQVNLAIITEMRELAANQVSGASAAAQFIGNKDEELEEVWLTIRRMNRAANAFGDEVQGSAAKYRLPRNRSEENIMATARAYHSDSEADNAKFIEYGLETDFRETLKTKIDKVTQHTGQANSGAEQRGGATHGLIDAAGRGMNNSRKMDSIVRIKYENNPQKLAEWTIASHLDKAPKRQSEDPAPTA